MQLATLADHVATETGVLAATAAPIVIGLAISTIELLYLGRELDGTGIYGWDALQSQVHDRRARVRIRIYSYRVCRIVLWARLGILCLLGAWIVGTGRVPAPLVALVLASQLYVGARHPIGADGSDQMFSVVLVALAVATTFDGNRLALHASIWFLALQSALVYASSGVAKLVSPMWRSGDALFRILCTETYGSKWAAQLLEGRPRISRFLSWCVIGLETSFPLVLLLPPHHAVAALTLPLAFHAACGVVMGLNSFVWAFPATYPAIVFCAAQLRASGPT